MYERRSDRLLPLNVFFKRLAGAVALAFAVMLLSLAIGVVGYHALGGLPWIDAIYNASMILGGMGPVDELHGTAAKLFASAYAIYSGLVLIATIGLALSPLVHRLLHRFHIDEDDIPREPDEDAARGHDATRVHSEHPGATVSSHARRR
jgi:hypothetical protein